MDEKPVDILVVEDEAGHAELICRAFRSRSERFNLTVARDLRQARRHLAAAVPGLLIVDYRLPDGMGLELLPGQNKPASFPFIIMTGHGDEQVAVEAMKAGAMDYVVKSAERLHEMPHIAERALREWKLRLDKIQAEEALQKANIELERQVARRTAHLENEIKERKRAEEALRLNESRLEALLRLSEMDQATQQELADFALEAAIGLTKSKMGYIAFLNADETILSLLSSSKGARPPLEIGDNPTEEPVEKTGLWEEAVRQRKAVITNDYQAAGPLKLGYPVGQGSLIRHMHVPVIDGQRIVAVAGVGNKDTGYDESDVRQLTLLMQGMWRLIQCKRADDDQKRFEAQLQQIRKLETIATLSGGIAHEFNNALTVVAGQVELLQMNLADHKNVKKFGQATQQSIQRLCSLTNQLLAYAGRGKYRPEILKLNDLLKSAVPILMHDLNPDIRVETDLSSDVSSIKVDVTQWQMIISAILKNASEAIDRTGHIRIRTRAEKIEQAFASRHPGLKPGRYARLTIEDDGKGMDEETRKKIFEPFFSTKFQGRGLGMAAVYGIVKNHDGYIYVDSKPGQGTLIHIFLPLVEKETKEVPPPVRVGT
ncbi:MAG: GAF domain-containing protein [Desulfobacterales bacterium]|nr:MAG: GAF domain-containing protein [Desulfobacterales bacterium]